MTMVEAQGSSGKGASGRWGDTGQVTVGLLVALPQELGPFTPGEGEAEGQAAGGPGRFAGRIRVHGIDGSRARVAVLRAGVGKVRAAHGAACLVAAGADALLVCGTAGGLLGGDPVGTLVHVTRAVQWDLAVRSGHGVEADEGLRAAWADIAPGATGQCLTADRPALGQLARARRARGIRGALRGRETAVTDMETAAVGAVASAEGLPWAALRVISDGRLGPLAALHPRRRREASFPWNAPRVAGVPAATVPALCRALFPA